MKIIISILSLCMTVYLSAQTNQGINFSDASLQTLLKQAKRENKLVFVDCYTTWCKPCKIMDSLVYTRDTVGAFFNTNFISMKLDMESKAGKLFNMQNTVGCYPTYLFLDANGKIVHRDVGGRSLREFIAIGKTALDVNKRFEKLETTYQSGNATTDQFIHYAQARRNACLLYNDILSDYEAKLTEPDLSGRGAWNVLNLLVNSTDSRIFQYMIKHRILYDTQFTSDSVDRVIENLYLHSMNQVLWSDTTIDTAKYLAIRTTVLQLNMPIADKIVLRGDISLYYAAKDWNRYGTTVIAYLNEYGSKESYIRLNDYAWYFYQYVENVGQLEIALSWIKESVATNPEYFNTDTYAALLYKLCKYKEAKTWATIAIELGKAENMNYSETEKLLEKIQDTIK